MYARAGREPLCGQGADRRGDWTHLGHHLRHRLGDVASYSEVLTVTAIADFNGLPGGGAASTCRSDVDDTEANFSNWAVLAADQNHTIAAPGVCINSTWMLGGYNTISGTSMASPHVTGVAALCTATGACTGTPAQIISKLRTDAQNYTTANPGYGFTSPGGRFYGYLTRASY